MNCNKSSASFNIIRMAKFLLLTLASLSVTSLFSAAAYAADAECPPAYMIKNSYAPNGEFTHRIQTWDWQLAWPAGLTSGHYAELKLVSAKLTSIPGKSTLLKSATCDYNDGQKNHDGTSKNGDLRLEITTSGKLSHNSYIPTSGTIKDQTDWKDGKAGNLIDGFTWICTVGGSKICGGFDFSSTPQVNSYWDNAMVWCTSWWEWWRAGGCARSTNPNSYKARVFNLDNTIQGDIWLREECGYMDPYGNMYCKQIYRPRDPFCKEPKCDAEIAAVNNIIGGNKHIGGNDQGMAKHLNLCWKEYAWRNTNRPNKADASKPNTEMDRCPHDGVVSWPDYKTPGF